MERKGVKTKTLEHRLKLLSQEEQLLKGKLSIAESALSKKEQELLLTLQSRSSQGEPSHTHVELLEYTESSDKFRALQVLILLWIFIRL